MEAIERQSSRSENQHHSSSFSAKKLHAPLLTSALWCTRGAARPSLSRGQSRFVVLPGFSSRNSMSTLAHEFVVAM